MVSLASVTVRSEGSGRRWLTLPGLAAAAASVVVFYVWDDVLLASPVIAVTGILGPWVTFAVFSTLYSIGSFALALAGVRAYERWNQGAPSRFAEWLTRQSDRRRAGWGRRVLDSSKILGFVGASFALGGVVTTFFVRYGGRRDGIERIAALSSLIFGITFTALYTGVASAIFAI